ncbi:hypothetical protein ACIRD9_42495 [Streptomyces violaceus]
MKRAPVRDRNTCILLGWTFTLLGFWLLWSAYEGRGRGKPLFLAPFLPW